MYNKITTPIKILANGILVVSMSTEEVKKQLKQLEDPEIAKQLGQYLKKMKAGNIIEADLSNNAMRNLFLALQIFMGVGFAEIPTIKENLTLKLKNPVTLEDLTQIKQTAEDIKKEFDEVNKAIKDKTNITKPGTTFVRIGDQKLIAKNQYEYEVLKAMVKLESALKKNKAKGFIDEKTFEENIAAMVKAFNSGRPIVFS